MKIRLLAPLAVCCTVLLCAESVPKSGVTPVEAQLLADVRAHQLKVGQPVYARVQTRWNSTDCSLRPGAILEGM